MTKFSHYSELYLDFKKHELKFSTLDKYTNIIKDRINPFFGEMDVSQIRPSDVKKWLYALEDVGSKSQRIYLSVLRGVLQEAVYDEVILRNPVAVVKLPKYKAPKIKPFTADEVNMIMNLAKNFNYKHYLDSVKNFL